MFESELISKIKNVQLKARYLVTDILSGEYESAFKGQGIEFSEVREYVFGDDIRSIDWNVTARMDNTYIKEFHEERELTLMILLDLSSSQNFGSVNNLKSELATELSSVLSYLALKNNDKVGLLSFTDKIEKYIPPKKGNKNIWKIIREILTFSPEGNKTNIANALDFLMGVLKRKSIIFIISDFIDKDYEKAVKIASKRHDLIAIKILDPRETSLPKVGLIEFEDAESGEHILINTYDNTFRENYEKLAKEEIEKTRKFFKSNKIDYLEINTSIPYTKTLMDFFKLRDRRRR